MSADTGSSDRDAVYFCFGPFRLEPTARLLLKDGNKIEIGGRALDLLIELVTRPGEVIDKRALQDSVWRDVNVSESNLRVHLAALRRALGDDRVAPRYIVNVTGRGYSFVAPVTRRRPAPDPPPKPVAGLPPIPAQLVGRNAVVENLGAAILAERFISVVGPAGIGKTSVAIATCRALQGEFSGEQIRFVDLAALTDPHDVPGAVAAALGIPVAALSSPRRTTNALEGRRALIILDNCEHVIDVAARVAEWLFDQMPAVHILATSREALRVRGENIRLLEPLVSPQADVPTAIEALATPAVQLFMNRATASGYQKALSDADAPVVADICRRLDGHALAIQLVASRAAVHGIQELAALLDSGTALAFPGQRSAAPRHQTLEAMLGWSFALLAPHEQRALLRLSVFVGPFTPDAAEAIADFDSNTSIPINQILTSLSEKFLIVMSTTNGNVLCRMPETTRLYAVARLETTGEADEIARRHAIYYTELLDADRPEPGLADSPWLEVRALQIGSIRRALDWSFADDARFAEGIRLARAAAPLFIRLSLLTECHRWCQRALAALTGQDRGSPLELALQESLAVSGFHTRGHDDSVDSAIRRGLELAEKLNDVPKQLDLVAALDLFLTRRGDFHGALAAAKRYKAIAERLGDPKEIVLAEWMVAAELRLTGNHAEGYERYRSSFEREEQLGVIRVNRFGYDHRMRALVGIARTSFVLGLVEQASRHAQRGIEEAITYGGPVSRCMAIVHTAPILLWCGNYAEASKQIETAIGLASEYALLPFHALATARKGQLLVLSGDPKQGVPVLRNALDVLNAENHRPVISAVSRSLAEGLLQMNEPEAALSLINAVVAGAEKTGERLRFADLLRGQGEIMLAQPAPDMAAAEAVLTRAIGVAREQSTLSWELQAATVLARLYESQGRAGEALDLLGGVYSRFTEGFDTVPLIAARQVLDRVKRLREH